jgi:hypothetical protein
MPGTVEDTLWPLTAVSRLDADPAGVDQADRPAPARPASAPSAVAEARRERGYRRRCRARWNEALVGCGLFLSIGTSGSVYPAAGFVALARQAGAHTVELNLEPSNGASLFAEGMYGAATQVVPGFVDSLLRRK